MRERGGEGGREGREWEGEREGTNEECTDTLYINYLALEITFS